jgi:hypothetical protein
MSHHKTAPHAVATTLRDALESAGEKASEILTTADLGRLSAVGHDAATDMRAQLSALPANPTVRRVKRRGARHMQRVAEAMGEQARRVDSTLEPKRRWRKTVVLLLLAVGGGVAVRQAMAKRGAGQSPYTSLDDTTYEDLTRPESASEETTHNATVQDGASQRSASKGSGEVARLPRPNGPTAATTDKEAAATNGAPKKRPPAKKAATPAADK